MYFRLNPNSLEKESSFVVDAGKISNYFVTDYYSLVVDLACSCPVQLVTNVIGVEVVLQAAADALALAKWKLIFRPHQMLDDCEMKSLVLAAADARRFQVEAILNTAAV